MNKPKLKKLASTINYDKELDIKFVDEPKDHFAFDSIENCLEVSNRFYELTEEDIMVYLTHEIGHANTIPKDCIYMTDYGCEFDANKWALMRLDELGWSTLTDSYIKYLEYIANLDPIEEDLEYKEAATDLLKQLQLTQEVI